MKLTPVLFFIGVILFLSGCGSSVSGPDQLTLEENETNLTQKNLEKISKIELDDPNKFSFAIVADSHTDYDDFGDIIADINKNPEPSFLIHAGDFTDFGLLSEYRQAIDILSESVIPYVTVIGNHDCWTNGKQIYREMFGDFNYSFVFGDYKFIFMDANILANGGEPPDFDWLENELSDHDLYNLVFPIVHMPPFDFTWSDEMEDRYKQLMAENSVSLSIHGHQHRFWYGERYDDGVKYLVVDDVDDRNYCIVSVDSVSFNVENINIDE